VGVQKVRWDKEGIVGAGEYIFFYRKRKWNSSIKNRYFVCHRI